MAILRIIWAVNPMAIDTLVNFSILCLDDTANWFQGNPNFEKVYPARSTL
jgi:hypothetical protein